MKKNWNIKASWWSLLCIVFIALFYSQKTKEIIDEKRYFDAQWTNLRHDAGIYYAYLPATFIKNDWRFSFLDHEPSVDAEKQTQYWAFKSEHGGWVPKMTLGKALMDLPFFLVADFYAQHSELHERTGFSKPYMHAIAVASIFYAILGLVFLRSVLLRYFSDRVTAISLLLLALATNLFHYATHETGYTHPHNFFLLSTLIFLTTQWNSSNRIGTSMLFGIFCGLLVLLRPVNLLLLLPLPFFSVYFKNSKLSWHWLKIGLQQFIGSKQMLIALMTAFLVVLPQLLFWKTQSESWLYYSYEDEGFFWSRPQIIKGLFSFRKGWFIYTPIMFFATIGLYKLFQKLAWLGLSISVTLVLFVYATFSWWCWWYGGGFGARTMIDIYPFMVFGLAALTSYLIQKNVLVKLIVATVIVFTIKLNTFQTKQYHLSLIHWDAMTFQAYKAVFFKEQFPENFQEMLAEPNYQKQKETGRE
jgi:hypothetical protein